MALSNSGSLRSEQVVVSGGDDTRIPAQRTLDVDYEVVARGNPVFVAVDLSLLGFATVV